METAGNQTALEDRETAASDADRLEIRMWLRLLGLGMRLYAGRGGRSRPRRGGEEP